MLKLWRYLDVSQKINSCLCDWLNSDLVRYMEETPASGKDVREHAQAAVQIAIRNPLIHDEMFCQLMKQTTRNPKQYVTTTKKPN